MFNLILYLNVFFKGIHKVTFNPKIKFGAQVSLGRPLWIVLANEYATYAWCFQKGTAAEC